MGETKEVKKNPLKCVLNFTIWYDRNKLNTLDRHMSIG